MVRKLNFVFAIIFGIVVATGYVPQFVTETHMTPSGPEKTLFNLFLISLIDDVTHTMSAVVMLAGALHSHKASVLAFTGLGWYYAFDAFFYLSWGVINDKPWYADIMLNAPHVGIATIMLATVYWWVPKHGSA